MDHPLPGCNRARTCTALTEPHPFFATFLCRCTGDHSTTYDTAHADEANKQSDPMFVSYQF